MPRTTITAATIVPSTITPPTTILTTMADATPVRAIHIFCDATTGEVTLKVVTIDPKKYFDSLYKILDCDTVEGPMSLKGEQPRHLVELWCDENGRITGTDQRPLLMADYSGRGEYIDFVGNVVLVGTKARHGKPRDLTDNEIAAVTLSAKGTDWAYAVPVLSMDYKKTAKVSV